jgi:hypothetical protein
MPRQHKGGKAPLGAAYKVVPIEISLLRSWTRFVGSRAIKIRLLRSRISAGCQPLKGRGNRFAALLGYAFN